MPINMCFGDSASQVVESAQALAGRMQLELQIPYKLFLGGEKDIEDAKYPHNLFKDVVLMEEFLGKLGVKTLYTEYLR
jgi:hypothetical protein